MRPRPHSLSLMMCLGCVSVSFPDRLATEAPPSWLPLSLTSEYESIDLLSRSAAPSAAAGFTWSFFVSLLHAHSFAVASTVNATNRNDPVIKNLMM